MTKIIWTTEKRKVNSLIFSEINPRKVSDKKRKSLAKSIDRFNLVEIPVINKDSVIIAGHQKVTYLLDNGRENEIIDVRVPNRQLTKKEAKEYMLISNHHAGTYDEDILQEHFSDIDLEEIGLEDELIFGKPKDEEELEIKEAELVPYTRTHVLLSFPPEKMIKIQSLLEKLKAFDFIEYEQASN